jgi:hypothetical protein
MKMVIWICFNDGDYNYLQVGTFKHSSVVTYTIIFMEISKIN